MLELVAGAALGALLTLAVTWWLNRNDASRGARRDTYLELLTMLKAVQRLQKNAVWDPERRMPDVATQEVIDSLNARLELDSSAKVRKLSAACFSSVQRFNASVAMKAPVELDQHGFYRYRFDLMSGGDEASDFMMRVSLGGTQDDLEAAVSALADQLRAELHGRPVLQRRLFARLLRN